MPLLTHQQHGPHGSRLLPAELLWLVLLALVLLRLAALGAVVLRTVLLGLILFPVRRQLIALPFDLQFEEPLLADLLKAAHLLQFLAFLLQALPLEFQDQLLLVKICLDKKEAGRRQGAVVEGSRPVAPGPDGRTMVCRMQGWIDGRQGYAAVCRKKTGDSQKGNNRERLAGHSIHAPVFRGHLARGRFQAVREPVQEEVPRGSVPAEYKGFVFARPPFSPLCPVFLT